ncbi:MAG: FIST N-terminal domain-containing protein [Candidatus Eisenbacteria bacterium]
MKTIAGVGKSISASPELAGKEAAELACAPLAGAAPDFCLVFGTSGYDQSELLRGVRSVTGDARLSGCSGEGIIAAADSDERDRAVGVIAIRSRTLRFETFLIREYSSDPGRCGRELGRQVMAGDTSDALALLVFPDGLVGNCTDLLRALEAAIAPGIPIVGGSAGDAMVFERTWQFQDGDSASDSVAAVLVRGRGEVAIQVSHGCQTVGLQRLVTNAGGGWLRSIDGKPAWSVFREYLDGDPEDLNAEGIAHLSLAAELDPDAKEEYGSLIVRTPLQLDRESGALFFPGGGIATGTPVWIARRDSLRVRESARACAARIANHRRGERPAFVLQFDCAGRGRIMFGSRAAEEIVRPLQEEIGTSTPWLGFHTYGEIAPIKGRSYYHNYTVVLCAFFDNE